MTIATRKPADEAGSGHPPASTSLSITDLVILRIAAGSATRADLQRDLAAIVAPRTPGTQFRRAAELAIGGLIARHLASETRGRLTATPAGEKSAAIMLAPLTYDISSWPAVKAALLLRALDLETATASMTKALNRREGIAALVLQRHFDFTVARVMSPTTLRAELAVVALERAFGNKIKTGLGKGSGLPAKAGRVLAGQLFRQPREITSDGKLIVALAAEILSSKDQSVDGLSLALLRRLTETPDPASPARDRPRPAETAKKPAKPAAKRAPSPANDAAPMQLPPAPAKVPAIRPDMLEFASAVVSAARPVSQGWPGNRKAFISLVWNAIRNTRPEWELTEVAFKSMLAEAHRTGHVVLAGADLKDKCDLKELEDSKILYKNTVWHFVRVED